MSEPNDNFTSPQSPANQPTSPNDSTPGQSPVILEVQPSPSDTEKPYNCKYREPRKWKDYLEIGAFGVLCLYTFFAGWQSCTISNQLEADQRAWIGLLPADITAEEHGKIGVHFTIANTGRTPAREMKWESFDSLVEPKGFVTPEYTPMEGSDLYNPVVFPANLSKPDVTLWGSKAHAKSHTCCPIFCIPSSLAFLGHLGAGSRGTVLVPVGLWISEPAKAHGIKSMLWLPALGLRLASRGPFL